MTKKQIASYIDHTLLAANATVAQIEKLCDEAREYGFASVCINPCYVSVAKASLENTPVKVCTVIGFPLGANTSAVKAMEAVDAVKNGADEVDMVINIGAAKNGCYSIVGSDIKTLVDAVRGVEKEVNRKIIVKVIMETCLLDDETIKACCICAKEAGADFVKTSTGFATPKDKDGKSLPNGATAHHVELMRKTVGKNMGVKASGGIRTAENALEMLKAGASRIGASSGKAIVDGWDENWSI